MGPKLREYSLLEFVSVQNLQSSGIEYKKCIVQFITTSKYKIRSIVLLQM